MRVRVRVRVGVMGEDVGGGVASDSGELTPARLLRGIGPDPALER